MTAFNLGPALMFCPADRPERFAKALDRADAVILDLEDAVSADEKVRARGAVLDSHLDPERVVVRVSPPGTEDFVSDIATVAHSDYRRVMVAKAESPEQIRAIEPGFEVIALCETAKGIVRAAEIADLDNVSALMWGAEDLVASLGGTSSRLRDGAYRDVARHARSTVLIAASAAGKAAIDAVVLNLTDTKGLAREAADAAASGFTATACIHPDQVPIIREAYRPDDKSLAWARGVLEAAVGERGVFTYAGRMVDEPVLRHARTLLRRADA